MIFRPLKVEQHRVRMTIGGDKLTYTDDIPSPAASMLETKLLINNVISDKKVRFLTIDLENCLLQTIMIEPKFMKMKAKYFPEDIQKQYHISGKIAQDGYFYCRIKRGVYGLKLAARLACNQLVKRLGDSGYKPEKYAPNIWSHETRNTKSGLCVDDFGVKYYNKEDTNPLLSSLQNTITILLLIGKDITIVV